MQRAIIQAWHKYTPFGEEFYKPMLNFQLNQLSKYQDEYDKLYLIDSEWNLQGKFLQHPKIEVLKKEVDGHHWVQFKYFIPKIKEDAILFLDNDVVIYRKGIIDNWFKKIEEGYDFVGSFDGSGTSKEVEKYPFLVENNYKRMGSYYFILTKKLLEKIGDYDFAPISEEGFDSFGKFTLQMLDTKPKIYEIEDDRTEFDGEKSQKDLGYYHIRSGSVPAILLSWKHYGHTEEYKNYLKNQPKVEYLRQCKWYKFMGGDPTEIINNSNEF